MIRGYAARLKRGAVSVSRSRLFWQSLAAVAGGYALASAVAVFAGAVLPLPRAEAVLAGTLLGLAAYPFAIMLAFALRDLRLVWSGLLLPALLLAVIGWLLKGAP